MAKFLGLGGKLASMIVNDKSDRWEIFFQRNHALLAGSLGSEVADSFRPNRWIETLAAVITHDDAQAGFTEETHIDQAGAPLNFRNFGENLLQAERVVMEAQYRSKFVTLLVSMHAHGLRDPKKEKSPQLEEYLSRQEFLQTQLRQHLHISKNEATEAYQFLRWCDECSLILCEGRLTTEPTPIMFGNLHGVHEQHVFLNEKTGFVHMEPWCFYKDRFDISAEFYVISPKNPFSSSVALGNTLLSQMPLIKIWTFHK